MNPPVFPCALCGENPLGAAIKCLNCEKILTTGYTEATAINSPVFPCVLCGDNPLGAANKWLNCEKNHYHRVRKGHSDKFPCVPLCPLW